jgi:hypothetical protein
MSTISFTCHTNTYVIFPESEDTHNLTKYRIHSVCHGKTIPEIESQLAKIYAKDFIMYDCVIHYYFILAHKFHSEEMTKKLHQEYPNYSSTIKLRNKLISKTSLTNCEIEQQILERKSKKSQESWSVSQKECSEQLSKWYYSIREHAMSIKRGRPKQSDSKKTETNQKHNTTRKSNMAKIYQNVKNITTNCLNEKELELVRKVVSEELFKKLQTISNVCRPTVKNTPPLETHEDNS